MLKIFAETTENPRDEATEAMLGDIIAKGIDVVASFLNNTNGLEGRGSEEEGYDYDGSGDPLMPVQEEGYDYHGSGDPMKVQEGDHYDGSVTEPSPARFIY